MSKSFFNENLLHIINPILNDLRSQNIKLILTSQIIEKQIGRYVKDECPASKSFNANYGKFLKEHSEKLRIEEKRDKVNITDDYGGKTSCSEWRILY